MPAWPVCTIRWKEACELPCCLGRAGASAPLLGAWRCWTVRLERMVVPMERRWRRVGPRARLGRNADFSQAGGMARQVMRSLSIPEGARHQAAADCLHLHHRPAGDCGYEIALAQLHVHRELRLITESGSMSGVVLADGWLKQPNPNGGDRMNLPFFRGDPEDSQRTSVAGRTALPMHAQQTACHGHMILSGPLLLYASGSAPRHAGVTGRRTTAGGCRRR